jgi:hypothetical protein
VLETIKELKKKVSIDSRVVWNLEISQTYHI